MNTKYSYMFDEDNTEVKKYKVYRQISEENFTEAIFCSDKSPKEFETLQNFIDHAYWIGGSIVSSKNKDKKWEEL